MLKQITLFLVLIILNKTLNGAEAAPINKPKIVFITGTSCSGKSTITAILKIALQLSDRKWEFIAQDDDLDDLRPIESQVLCYDYRLILSQILQLTKQGCSVVCDLILYKNEEIKEFLTILKDYNVSIVLVHCPIEALVKRAQSRASDRNSPQSDGTSASKALGDYTELYKSAPMNSPRSLTRIPSAHLSEMKRKQSFSGSELSPEDEELKNIYGQMADKFAQESEVVYIRPEYEAYNLIIDTSKQKPEDSIDQIVRIMKS